MRSRRYRPAGTRYRSITSPAPRSRFANSDDGSEPLVGVAQRAHRAHLVKEARRALRQANNNIHRVLKPTYFQSVPTTDIYEAVERTGLTIPPDERSCILTGRQDRASWPLTFHGLPVRAHLWIT